MAGLSGVFARGAAAVGKMGVKGGVFRGAIAGGVKKVRRVGNAVKTNSNIQKMASGFKAHINKAGAQLERPISTSAKLHFGGAVQSGVRKGTRMGGTFLDKLGTKASELGNSMSKSQVSGFKPATVNPVTSTANFGNKLSTFGAKMSSFGKRYAQPGIAAGIGRKAGGFAARNTGKIAAGTLVAGGLAAGSKRKGRKKNAAMY